MAQSAEQSELLALLRKKSQGSYEKVRNAEARPGGRTLPAKLRKAYARATSLKLDRDKNENLYAYLYANCVEPKDYAGLHAGIMFNLSDGQWRSFEQCLDTFISSLKLLGFGDKIESASEAEFFSKVLPEIMDEIEKEKPYFEFHTSKKEKEDGSVNVFIDGLPPQGYEAPDRDVNEHAEDGYENKSPRGKTPPGKKEEPKTSAPPKVPGKSPPKAPPKAPFSPGDSVNVIGDFFGDGAADGDYSGEVVSVDVKQAQCVVKFDGASDNYEIPFVNLSLATPAGSESSSIGKRVNSEPNYFGNAVSYAGEIVAYDVKSGKYTVRFEDDGQKLEMSAEEIVF